MTGDGSLDPTAADWARKASDELAVAKLLASARHWQQAYHHAGFAIECALKACIMRREGLNRWPDRQDRPKLYVHDLRRLMIEASLQAELLHEVNGATSLGHAWAVAKDWSNEARYDPRPFPETLAADMVWAAGEAGLVSWLLTR